MRLAEGEMRPLRRSRTGRGTRLMRSTPRRQSEENRTRASANYLSTNRERTTMKLKYLAIGVIIALIPVAGAGGRAAEGRELAHATLTGKAETPKGDPDGSGTAEVKITGTKVCWEIKASRVAKLVAAHIHKGKAGVAGPVVVPFGKTYQAKGCATTTAAIAAAIMRSPGAYYVNVHNAKYPGGALRGQLHS